LNHQVSDKRQLRKQGEGEWALSGQEPDQTGESLTAEGAGAGTRRVTPKETDKRQPLKSVLWKVKPNGRKGKRELRQTGNFLKTEEGESRNRYRSEGSSNATHTKV